MSDDSEKLYPPTEYGPPERVIGTTSRTPQGEFLMELYSVEVTHPRTPPYIIEVLFAGSGVRLRLSSDITVDVDVQDDRSRLHRALAGAGLDLPELPSGIPQAISGYDAGSLWLELHYDLATDVGLNASGTENSYQSVLWLGGEAVVAAGRPGITRTVRVDLTNGMLPAAVSVDLGELLRGS